MPEPAISPPPGADEVFLRLYCPRKKRFTVLRATLLMGSNLRKLVRMEDGTIRGIDARHVFEREPLGPAS